VLGDGEGSLSAAERGQLSALRVPRRRADWVAGRVTAKSVVAEALSLPTGSPLSVIEIVSEPSGRPHARVAPEAPPVARFAAGTQLPVSISISHVEGMALCAATRLDLGGERRRALGIDLGRVEPRSPEFVDTFFTDDEKRFVREARGGDPSLLANLVWCAKEAVLKALGIGLTVDTLEVNCKPLTGLADPTEWPLAPTGREWHPFVALCGSALVPGGEAVHGIWRSFPGLVAALAACPDDAGAR
jgi:4'-phosphopantetheinyl transferase